MNDPEIAARHARRLFGLCDEPSPDLPRLVDRWLHEPFDGRIIQVVSGVEIQGDEARAFPSYNLIKLSAGLMRRLRYGEAFARFVFAHECGHLFLKHRNDAAFSSVTAGNRYDPSHLAEEGEADAFAIEFLTPKFLIDGYERAEEIAEVFCVPVGIARRSLGRVRTVSGVKSVESVERVKAMRDEFKRAQERIRRGNDRPGAR